MAASPVLLVDRVQHPGEGIPYHAGHLEEFPIPTEPRVLDGVGDQTQRVFLSLQSADNAKVLKETRHEIGRLSEEYRFFHWHLEFPDVFAVPDSPSALGVDPATGWAGG